MAIAPATGCRACGLVLHPQTQDLADICPACAAPLAFGPIPAPTATRGVLALMPEPDEIHESYLPPSGWSLAGLFVGLLSVVVGGALLGPVAVVLGLVGLRHTRERPDTVSGVTLAAIAIACGVIAVLMEWLE